ncbi:PIR Pirin [Candida maltosa Xu316]
MSARPVTKVLNSQRKVQPTGAVVHRSLGIGISKDKHFNPFLLFDLFSVQSDEGFQAHPHRGHETITYVIKGAVAHEDFTDAKGILYPGDLQFMTAGKGIIHSEMPVPDKNGGPGIGIQLWVDLPEAERTIEPGYRDLRDWETPETTSEDGKVWVKVISGKAFGVESIQKLAYIPVDFYHFKVQPGGEFKQDLQSDFSYLLFVVGGNGLVVNGETEVGEHKNATLQDRTGDYISLKNTSTTDEEVEFVLIGGKVLDQETFTLETIVADSEENVRRGILDFAFARNGFERAKTWKSLISNGVTQEMIDGPLNGTQEYRDAQKKAYFDALNKNGKKDDNDDSNAPAV